MHSLNTIHYVKKSWLLLLAFGMVFIGLLSLAPTASALTDAEIQQKAEDFCGKGADGRIAACRAGFRAGANNGSKADTCDSRTVPQEKTKCEAGFDEGKKIAPAPTGGATPAGGGATPAAGGGDPSSGQPDCDAKASQPLSWILCPIIDLGANFSDFALNKIISPLLSDVPITADPADGGYIAWKQFRLLGNIVLIASLLAVVYAQARGDK